MDAITWKVINPASFSTTLIVLIFAGLCKGLLNQHSDYNLTVPDLVSVQHGLCAHIACSFTYNHIDRMSSPVLYGYWLQKKDRSWHVLPHWSRVSGILVATNDKRQEFQGSVANRFRLTGDPEEGDCSFSILNAQLEDTGEYYFRVQGDYLRYSYITNHLRTHKTLQILVTDLEPPQLWGPSLVLSGKEAVYTCSAPGPCFKIQPEFSWLPRLIGHKLTDWSEQHTNDSWTYRSNFTFTPSPNSQGKRLTCRIKYPHIRKSVEKTIQIDIADPPKTVEISTNSTDHGHVALCSQETQGNQDSAVVREGESLSLLCNAKGKPNPTLSWMKGSETLKSTEQGQECVLLLSNVRSGDAGEYQCGAETPYGSANKTLRLCVLYPPTTVAISVSQACRRGRALIQDSRRHMANGSQLTAQEGDSLQLLCTVQSYPPSEIIWVKGSRTLERHGPSPDTWLELTNLTVEAAGQYACQAKNVLGFAQGIIQLSVEYGPRLSSNQSRSMCWREDQSLHCNCSLNSWPLPQIQWEVDGKILNEDNVKGPPEFTTSVQENAVISSLIWTTGNLDKSHNLICRGANSLGTYALHFLFIPSTKGSHASSIVSGLCGALVAIILGVLCLGLIKFYKQKKAKESSKAGGAEVLNSANGGHQRSNDGSLIYSNIPPLGKKSPCNNQSREKISTSSRRVLSTTIPEPEELYYATLEFSKLKAKEPTPQEEFVEYTEVKQK